MSRGKQFWIIGLAALLVLIALGLGLAILRHFDPNVTSFYPQCRFYELTGLRCPGCGTTRATHQLLHGNVAAAFRYNCLYVVTLPLMAWVAIRWLWRVWREIQPPPEQWRRTTRLAIASVVAILSFWIVRNLPGWPLY
ncbi:MAG: DUF2752 domain-containing protein [Verrucomicrobiales bacterium]